MFCSNCGAEVGGNFCSSCGAASGAASLARGGGARPDWRTEVRYEELIRLPEVRDRVARHGAMAEKRMSGEDFLGMMDKVVPLGVSLKQVGAVVQPIYAQLGLKTGKEEARDLQARPGALIVSALCSFARRGHRLRNVRQFEDGCMLEAELASNMWSFAGTLYVGVRRSGEGGARVEAATRIPGQLYDWGKSKRCLEGLFEDLSAEPT